MAFYSSGVEYGIHSLMCMVDSKGDARDMSVREIAELQNVPYDYLAKIFTRLSKAGLVRSIEGKGGGFQLARAAEHITVLDVANAIDGEKRIFECREIRQRLAVFDEQPPQWACEGRRYLRCARGHGYGAAANGRGVRPAYYPRSGAQDVP